MNKYYEGNANDYIKKTIANMFCNDDLYDECNRLIKCNKQCNTLTKLKNNVVYNEIAYGFRLKKLNECHSYGKIYNAYFSPMQNAMNQLLGARDELIDYCIDHNIEYDILQNK